jgi:hypothetical protein
MCDPVTISMAALSMVSTQTQAQGQKKMVEANAANALDAANDQLMQLNLQQSQDEENALQEQMATDLQMQQAMSTAAVAGGESGGSLNNNAAIQDIARQGLVANSQVTQQLERNNMQREMDRKGVMTGTQGRINSVARPSGFATALSMGAGVAGAAASGGYGGKKTTIGAGK